LQYKAPCEALAIHAELYTFAGMTREIKVNSLEINSATSESNFHETNDRSSSDYQIIFGDEVS
ncbi:MAG: hypothetical protein KBE16_06655, partial [Alphaproteobacteria bacterium]|nr:hypothetical protein [Alphaproteobacteria bacterium]